MVSKDGLQNYSGWLGGIGITFGSPIAKIPDVTELGHEITWGEEDLAAAKILALEDKALEKRLKGHQLEKKKALEKADGNVKKLK